MGYNAFDDKNKILFERGHDNHTGEATNGIGEINGSAPLTIGIPRVLNMYENYPFWHTLIVECGMRVKLSPESTGALYQKGVGSVMSDNICFPAKLVHGHILALTDMSVDRIFYPMVIKEEKEFDSTANSFNCPIVSGYPDVIRSAIDTEEQYGIPFDKPVVTFSDDKALKKGCYQYLASLGVKASVFDKAFQKAIKVREETKHIIQTEQKKLFDKAVEENKPVFVVAGRPYHADPLVHQKTAQILADMGVDVFTEDVFCNTENGEFSKLNVIAQWSYPNRVLQAATEVAKLPHNVQLVQLNSFGCGSDSFFMDETSDILKQADKNHTILRIDEIASPGSVRLRMRSLIESIKLIDHDNAIKSGSFSGYPAIYKKEDRRKTILAPWFADFISPFIPAIGELAGYKIVNLPRTNSKSAGKSLIYGHNEVCYPSTLVLGDIIAALQSGSYDVNDVVVAITQTGGQCRATNYVAQIKAGLKRAGFSQIPVLIMSSGKVYQNEQSAFKIPVLKIIKIGIYAILYGDALQAMYSSSLLRESEAGASKRLFDKCIGEGIEAIRKNDHNALLGSLERAVEDYNRLAIQDREFTKVGLIGEIYAKYNQYGQAHISEWLRSQKMEVLTPPFIDFIMQYFVNSEVNVENGVKRGGALKHYLKPLTLKYMNDKIARVEKIMENYRFHYPAESVFTQAEYASEILDLSNQFGEGWNIAAEVASYSRNGINKIVCVQPFGCIANHVVAKGVENRMKKLYPAVNLLYLDIDSSIAQVNLQNRLHFLIN